MTLLIQLYTTFVRSIQTAPFLIQSVTVIAFINFIIFVVKSMVLEPKFYYNIQILVSFIVLTVTLFSLRSKTICTMLNKIISSNNSDNYFYFQIFTKKFASYPTALLRSTWLWNFLNFLVMSFTAVLGLVNWDCTMFVRITFAICFIFFFTGHLYLKWQMKIYLQTLEKKTEACSDLKNIK